MIQDMLRLGKGFLRSSTMRLHTPNTHMSVSHYEARAVTVRSEMYAGCCKILMRACESVLTGARTTRS